MIPFSTLAPEDVPLRQASTPLLQGEYEVAYTGIERQYSNVPSAVVMV
jgi:hypothetical protein